LTATSPVAKLNAGLPKGNGLSRAVPELHDSRGTLVPFVGLLRVEETGLDADDVMHLRASIQRFELAIGPIAADAKDLITRCSTAATSVTGQMVLLAPDTSNDDEDRRGLLRDLEEWGHEQKPKLNLTKITDLWNSWHGGFYDARLEEAPVRYLREFCITKGVIADTIPLSPTAEATAAVPEPGFSSDGTEPAADDDDLDDDAPLDAQ
jgi:hypothetical protein